MARTTAEAITTTGTSTSSSRAGRPRRGAAAPAVPLGSLTQRGATPVDSCAECGSASVTTLSLTLTDGTPARFTSCRTCGQRRWADDEGDLSISDVLVRTTKA